MRRRAEAVEPEPLAVAGQPQRAVADQPAAQQRRELQRSPSLGQLEAEALVGDRPLRVAAVDVAAREARPHAQVLAPRAAIRALAARPAQPRHADPPAVVGAPDDLVAEDQREVPGVELAVAQVQVGAADAARLDAQLQLPRPRLRLGDLGEPQRPAGRVEQHRAHAQVNSVSTPASTNAPAHTASRLIHDFLSTLTPTWS